MALSTDEQAVIDGMDDDELARRIEQLARWDRYDTVASINSRELVTPKAMRAFAALAEELDAMILGTDALREKGPDELAQLIARYVLQERKDERERALAVEFRARNTHP